MACYHPKRVALDEDGRLDWSVVSPIADVHEVVLVPCRHCIGCTAGSAREWAIRCYHELQSHKRYWKDPDSGIATEVPYAVMATLTYNDESLPSDGLLSHRHVQLFLKKLRNRRSVNSIRFFMCGEYGGRTGRPHYHAILFGEDFSDRYQIRTSDQQTLSCSFELDEIWGAGRATLDDVNFNTIRYVVGYITKKSNANGNFTGPLAEMLDKTTGDLTIKALQPEYRVMSRRPGLGREWIERNYERVYPLDQVDINGQSFNPPGYYDRWLKSNHPRLYAEVQLNRTDQRIQSQKEWTPTRCASEEAIHSQRLKQDYL